MGRLDELPLEMRHSLKNSETQLSPENRHTLTFIFILICADRVGMGVSGSYL
jgi:hypothetical protein